VSTDADQFRPPVDLQFRAFGKPVIQFVRPELTETAGIQLPVN
jgi:hypothetical protein